MKDQGYRIREGYSEAKGMPFLTYYAPGLGKGRRDYNLGAGYRISEIRQRIAAGEKSPELPAKHSSALTISNLWRRAEGSYQKAYVLRVVYAVFYHSFPSGIPDSYEVRKDLLELDKLQEECACLVEYRLTEGTQAVEALEQVKAEEKQIRRESGTNVPEKLLKLKRDKSVLRRIVRRGKEEGLKFTQIGSGGLCLPEPVRNMLYPKEYQKGREKIYGIKGPDDKSLH